MTGTMHVTIRMLCAALLVMAHAADAQLCSGTYGNVTRCPSLNGAPTMKSPADIAQFVSTIPDQRTMFLSRVADGSAKNTEWCSETYAFVGCYGGSMVCDRETGPLLMCSQLCLEGLRCLTTPSPASACEDLSAKPNELCWGRGAVQREPATRPGLSGLAATVRPGHTAHAVWGCAWLAAVVRTKT